MRRLVGIPFCLFIIFCAAASAQKSENRPDFKKVFDDNGVTGAFVLYDAKNDFFVRYNPNRAKKKFTPASTFKIPNTLIGLETGEIPSEDHVFKWDGKVNRIKNWNRDLVLRDAFQYSCVPCYQDLARRVGKRRMKKWLKQLGYGNKDISGGIDRFWLGSSLKISPNQQISFLRKLDNGELPFSEQNHAIIKRIMLAEETSEFKLSAKTGWASGGETNIGWYVGFVECDSNVFYFATNIETNEPKETFGTARVEITRKILAKLDILD